MRKRAFFGPAAAVLAALMIAAPAVAHANKNTTGEKIVLEICRMETFADAFALLQVRRFGPGSLPWSIRPTLKKQPPLCEYWTG